MPLRRMTSHTLDVLYGSPQDWRVEYTAKFSKTALNAISGGVVFEGRVVSLNSNGEFELGVSGTRMPMFLKQDTDNPDVATYTPPYDPTQEPLAPVAIQPGTDVVVSAYVAIGGFELATTEFDSSRTYSYNDTLTAPTGTDINTSGKLTNANAVPYVNAVCGVVSRPPYKNAFQRNVLAFWPVYLPAGS